MLCCVCFCCVVIKDDLHIHMSLYSRQDLRKMNKTDEIMNFVVLKVVLMQIQF
jgi:hypothetical protein